MNLDTARKRHGKARRRRVLVIPEAGVPAEINVTPLVDVVLVLLIIFMVMTPLVEKELHVLLPAERHTDSASQTTEQLLVSLSEGGALRINDEPVSGGAYVARLGALLARRESAQRVVFVMAKGDASYRALVSAIAGAKRAGAVSVGVVP